MSDARAETNEGGLSEGRLLVLVLHKTARQLCKASVATLRVLREMKPDARQSLLEDVVTRALASQHVPQLRLANSKTAPQLSLAALAYCMGSVKDLLDQGFNQAGELSLWVGAASSSSQQEAAAAAAAGRGKIAEARGSGSANDYVCLSTGVLLLFAADGGSSQQGSSTSGCRAPGNMKATFAQCEQYLPRHTGDSYVYEVASTDSSTSSSISQRNHSSNASMRGCVDSRDQVPAGAKLLWKLCTFRGQFMPRHMFDGKDDDPQRWPQLLNMIADLGAMQTPGMKLSTARAALEKKITQQAKGVSNAHQRQLDPEGMTRSPNEANLQEVEAATVKWEQTQRPLFLQYLEGLQQQADSSKPVKVAFPNQLARDITALRRRAAAAAGSPGSRLTTVGGGSVGSCEQEQQQRRASQGPLSVAEDGTRLPAAPAPAAAGVQSAAAAAAARGAGGGEVDVGFEVDEELQGYMAAQQAELMPRRSPRRGAGLQQQQQQQEPVQQQGPEQQQQQQPDEQVPEPAAQGTPFAHAALRAGNGGAGPSAPAAASEVACGPGLTASSSGFAAAFATAVGAAATTPTGRPRRQQQRAGHQEQPQQPPARAARAAEATAAEAAATTAAANEFCEALAHVEGLRVAGSSEEAIKKHVVESMGLEMYEAVLRGQQPNDDSLRRPTGSKKAVSRWQVAQASRKAAAGADEGAAAAAKLRKRSGRAAAASAAATKYAAPKAARASGGKRRKTSSWDSEDSADSMEGSEYDAGGDEAAAAAEGSAEEDLEEVQVQQRQQADRHRCSRHIQPPPRYRN